MKQMNPKALFIESTLKELAVYRSFEKCRKALDGQKRDRSTYQKIALWLKTMKSSNLKQGEKKLCSIAIHF